MSSPERDDDDLIETQVRHVSNTREHHNSSNRRRPAAVSRNINRINIRDRAHPYDRPSSRNRSQEAQINTEQAEDGDVEIVSYRTTPLAQMLQGYHSSEDEDYTDSGIDDDLMEDVLAILEGTQTPEEFREDENEIQLVDTRPARPDDELSVERVIRVLRNPRNGVGWSMLWQNMFAHPRNRQNSIINPTDAETYEVMEVIRRSLEDDTAPRTISVKDINQKQIPTTTKPGYTRSLTEKQPNPVCVQCHVELGVGDNSSNISPVAKALSQRIFFLPCGHVYCGQCVADIRSRKNGSIQKSCSVVGCKQLLKKRGATYLKELFFN